MNKEKKKPITCDECNGDGVVYTHVNKQDETDIFSLPVGIYEDECQECGGTGHYTNELTQCSVRRALR